MTYDEFVDIFGETYINSTNLELCLKFNDFIFDELKYLKIKNIKLIVDGDVTSPSIQIKILDFHLELNFIFYETNSFELMEDLFKFYEKLLMNIKFKMVMYG